MSNAVYNRIRGVQIEPTKKTILMVLANIADDNGSTKLYATVDRLVHETCFKERTVRDALRHLEQIGAIKIKYRSGMPSTYLINPALSSPARDFGQDDDESFEDVDLQSNAGVVQLAAGVAQLNAPLHLMQDSRSQMQGGGAANADAAQFNCEEVQLDAPYTSTSFTSLTPSTSAQDAHAPESVKTDKPKKAKFDPLAIDLPANVNQKLWAEFVTMRKEIKKPVSTERAANGLINQLARLPEPNASLQQSIDNCWQGVFAIKAGSAYTQPLPSPKPLPQSQTPREPVRSYMETQTPVEERIAFANALKAKLAGGE